MVLHPKNKGKNKHSKTHYTYSLGQVVLQVEYFIIPNKSDKLSSQETKHRDSYRDENMKLN